jgi:hypothetical protein
VRTAPDGLTRRDALAAGATLVAGLAGCSDPGGGSTAASPGDGTPTGEAGELDLREANVVGVTVERQNGSIRFDVTLHHDDAGEDGYANWWQVERPDGTRLGRRDLLHPHASQPFTRSDTFALPADLTCVVVRGHDQTHGYGGRAMVVALDTGATRTLGQGTDRQAIDRADCP